MDAFLFNCIRQFLKSINNETALARLALRVVTPITCVTC